ncbi:hypothetical protein JW968_02840 [Candidatus Woesearchaeota archaeon]|nr:hypothetical protein [Candidatus Woesearchaeota archaeon]
MTDIICTFDRDDEKSRLNHVMRLIELGSWDNVYLVSYSGRSAKIGDAKALTFDMKHLPDLTEDIKNDLKGRISGFEVAVNIISGDGKLHIALMAALLRLGLGMRFMALTVDGIREI